MLVVGGSRGIGAAAARRFADRGERVMLTFNTRQARADAVRAELGPGACAAPLDLADAGSIRVLASALRAQRARLRAVVISAAGGMEAGRTVDYAWALNDRGPLALALALEGLYAPDARLILITSHEAHLFGRKPAYGPYAQVAETKKAGELRLLAARARLEVLGADLRVVSADIVEASPTAKLLELRDPGLLARRRAILGRLPHADDVAAGVEQAATGGGAFGDVIFVWDAAAYLEPQEDVHADL